MVRNEPSTAQFISSCSWLLSSEADPDIASLAAKWNCPVISDDSDFFIFDLKAGYVPLKHFRWQSGTLKAKLYTAETFCAHMEIEEGLLPLFASLLSNDVMKYGGNLKDLYNTLGILNHKDAGEKIETFQEHFLQNNVRSIPEGIEAVVQLCPEDDTIRSELRAVLESSVKSYDVADREAERYFPGEIGTSCSGLDSRNVGPFEREILEKFRRALFPSLCIEAVTVGKVFLNPQIEDFSVSSAHQCSRPLRRFLYGVAGATEVEEFTRDKVKGSEIKKGEEPVLKCKVQSADHELRSIGEPLRLATIPSLDEDKRREVVLSILESNTDAIWRRPREDQLFAASVRYWIKHAEPQVRESHLRALLLCYVTLAKGEHNQDAAGSDQVDEPDAAAQQNFAGPRKPRFDLEAQHNFAQWQCVMQEALNVNFVLQEPLRTPRIWSLYDGLLVQRLLRDPERAAQANEEARKQKGRSRL